MHVCRLLLPIHYFDNVPRCFALFLFCVLLVLSTGEEYYVDEYVAGDDEFYQEGPN